MEYTYYFGLTQAVIIARLMFIMGDGPQSPEQPKRRFLGFLRLRKSTDPIVPDAYVGEVDPKEKFYTEGAADTGGMIVAGQDDDVGIGYFPAVGPNAKKPPEKIPQK